MESPETQLGYEFEDEVIEVYEKFEKIHIRGVGQYALFEDRSIGWFIKFRFMGTMSLGGIKPAFRSHDKVNFRIERLPY